MFDRIPVHTDRRCGGGLTPAMKPMPKTFADRCAGATPAQPTSKATIVIHPIDFSFGLLLFEPLQDTSKKVCVYRHSIAHVQFKI
jgi:hypothetical protein